MNFKIKNNLIILINFRLYSYSSRTFDAFLIPSKIILDFHVLTNFVNIYIVNAHKTNVDLKFFMFLSCLCLKCFMNLLFYF